MPLHGVEDGLRAEAEHTAVPQEVAGREEAHRARRVGLLDEAAHLQRAACRRLAGLDVAEAGLGRGGAHAEQHHGAVGGQLGGAPRIGLEGGLVGNEVVGGQHQQRRGGILRLGPQRGHGDRRRGVAPGRLEQLGDAAAARGRQGIDLLARLEEVLAVGDDRRARAFGQRQGARERALQEAELAAELHERLGEGFARNRPEPGARAA